MVTAKHTREEVIAILSAVCDPEIPVLSIRDIGMLKDVVVSETGYEVVLTTTYTGCPAMNIIEEDIKKLLGEKDIAPVSVRVIFDPGWTTDCMNIESKQRLCAYGIAPPLHSSCNLENFALNVIDCPRCGSSNTVLLTRFGSTACKALYRCNDCREPFEYFKCH